MSKIYKIIIFLLVSESFFGQINNSEFSTAENYLKSINKLFLIDFVADDYLKEQSVFIKESDIIDKNWGRRNLALNSIKFLSKNNDTISYCNKGLNFNENQIGLFEIKNKINNSNFENPNIEKVNILKSLINKIEGLSNLEEGTKLNERKKQLNNLCKNYLLISTIKLKNYLKTKFIKSEIDTTIDELKKLPVVNENVSLENDKKILLEIYQNYEFKIEKLKIELGKIVKIPIEPSVPGAFRYDSCEELKTEYKVYPFLVDVIEKSKKNNNAYITEFLIQTEQKIEDFKPNIAPLEKKALTAKEIKEQETNAAEQKYKDSLNLEKEKRNSDKKKKVELKKGKAAQDNNKIKQTNE